jgi:PAS domain S-box-containing protein
LLRVNIVIIDEQNKFTMQSSASAQSKEERNLHGRLFSSCGCRSSSSSHRERRIPGSKPIYGKQPRFSISLPAKRHDQASAGALRQDEHFAARDRAFTVTLILCCLLAHFAMACCDCDFSLDCPPSMDRRGQWTVSGCVGGSFSEWNQLFIPLLLIWKRPSQPLTRHAVAIAQMLTFTLFIHLTDGSIETHFHVLASLALLAFYRDWRVLLTGSLVVAADHLLRGAFWPDSGFGDHGPDLARTVDQVGWVVFIDIFLCLSIRESLREMRHVATHQAELETLNSLVESQVNLRTAELAASEDRFRQLCAATPIGIYQTASAGRCLHVNHRWTEISGLSAEKSLGDGWIEALYPNDRESYRQEWATAARSGIDFERECRVLLPNQEIRWVVHASKSLASHSERIHRPCGDDGRHYRTQTRKGGTYSGPGGRSRVG